MPESCNRSSEALSLLIQRQKSCQPKPDTSEIQDISNPDLSAVEEHLVVGRGGNFLLASTHWWLSLMPQLCHEE